MMREELRSTSPPAPAVTLRRTLDALREGQALEPRGLSCELLAWELSEREVALERLLADAHRRKLVERSGIDRQGCLLYRLTERGTRFVTHPAGRLAQLPAPASPRFGTARRPA